MLINCSLPCSNQFSSIPYLRETFRKAFEHSKLCVWSYWCCPSDWGILHRSWWCCRCTRSSIDLPSWSHCQRVQKQGLLLLS